MIKRPIFLAALVLAFAASTSAQSTPLAVGDRAPDFTLADQTGATVRLSEQLAKGPAVLVFYRGHWCPFCVRQLSELRALPRPGETLALLAISVDAAETSRKLADKLALEYRLLSDPRHETIDRYGLHDPAYDGEELAGIPKASVYVIGRDGRVAWARVSDDYRMRPSVAEIRAAVDALAGK